MKPEQKNEDQSRRDYEKMTAVEEIMQTALSAQDA
jgi:hypothetical protein